MCYGRRGRVEDRAGVSLEFYVSPSVSGRTRRTRSLEPGTLERGCLTVDLG